MHIFVCLDSDPLRSLPLWAAFTDAQRAIPGLKITLLGDEEMVECMKIHPAVSSIHPLDMVGMGQFAFFPRGWRARQSLRQAVVQHPGSNGCIDPIGSTETRSIIRTLNGVSKMRRVGVANFTDSKRDYDYTSVFPLPSELNTIQSIRVLFAAALGYSLHDLTPDFGLVNPDQEHEGDVDLLVETSALPWSPEQVEHFRERIALTGLRVAYVNMHSAEQVQLEWSRIASANYILTGLSGGAWLAAALGRPGLCLCPVSTAASSGVISTRWARQKMINLDQQPFNQPEVVAESIIQVLERHPA